MNEKWSRGMERERERVKKEHGNVFIMNSSSASIDKTFMHRVFSFQFSVSHNWFGALSDGLNFVRIIIIICQFLTEYLPLPLPVYNHLTSQFSPIIRICNLLLIQQTISPFLCAWAWKQNHESHRRFD